MLDIVRSDRIFDSFLDLQNERMDNAEAISATDRKIAIGKTRKHRRAKRLAADESFEKYLEAKDEGFRGSFLDFLIENADQIIAILLKILSLFGL